MVEIPAGIGPELFEQAVQYLWTYHDGLRARFVQTEAGWQQKIMPADQNTEVPFTCFDFSALPVGEHTDAIEREAQKMQESLHIVDGPLLRVGFFNLGEKRRGRLLIILHHLIYDGASTIFFDDFYTLFQQISQGKAAQLPAKTTPLWTWLERLNDYAQSTELQQEGEYWFSLPWQETYPLPLDYPENHEKNTWGSVRSVQTRLSPEETEVLMRKIPQTYGVQVIDVLIAALSNTLTTWSNHAWSLFDAIDFGRNAIPNTDDLDLSRTVGWFSVHRHLLLQGELNAQPDILLKLIRAQIQNIPNRGLGYEILLYGSKDANVVDRLRKLPRSEVALSYDGFQYGNTNLTMAYEYPGPASNLENQRSYLLDCSVQIVDGRLIIRWGYNKNLHKQSTVKALAENYTQWLQALLAQYAAVQQGEPGNA